MGFNNFVGVWKLNSLERLSIDGKVLTKFNWIGRTQYDENGFMSVQIMKAERPVLDLEVILYRDLKKAYFDYTAYYGKYSVDEEKGTVTHHVQGSWHSNWMNEDLVRFYKFNENILELETEPEDEKGVKIVWRLLWERII